MSDIPPVLANPNVQNGFESNPSQTNPVIQKTLKMNSQADPTPRGLPPYDITGACDPPAYGFQHIKPPAQSMVPNQPTQVFKRPADYQTPPLTNKSNIPNNNAQMQESNSIVMSKKKKKIADNILSQRVRVSIPESETYMSLLEFERKLDSTILRKRFDIHEALKRPIKLKRKLRIYISNTFFPAKDSDVQEERSVASWQLKIEGRLLDDSKDEPFKIKRKFSSFFKSLVIELDKNLYGPDNHLVEWHRTPTTQETDGFQVRRPGNKEAYCTILLLLNYQPLQFKLDQRLARLLGVHTQTKPAIISTLWEYIKTHKLQDSLEREYINCDKYLEQIFNCSRMKFVEIPQKLNTLLYPPDPIVINHVISVDGNNPTKIACYDVVVEVDDAIKLQMNHFLLTSASQQEIQSLDQKIKETIETINQLKTNRDFFLNFAKDPQQFIYKWIVSQTNDLKTMTDVVGNPEEERRAEFYHQPCIQEAVSRYICSKTEQKDLNI